MVNIRRSKADRHYGGRKLTVPLAMETHCPLCGARPGDPCVYVARYLDKTRNVSSARALAIQQLVGQPTAQLHNERFFPEALRLIRWLSVHAPILWGSTVHNLTVWPDVSEICPNCPHNWGSHIVNSSRAIACPDCQCESHLVSAGEKASR